MSLNILKHKSPLTHDNVEYIPKSISRFFGLFIWVLTTPMREWPTPQESDS